MLGIATGRGLLPLKFCRQAQLPIGHNVALVAQARIQPATKGNCLGPSNTLARRIGLAPVHGGWRLRIDPPLLQPFIGSPSRIAITVDGVDTGLKLTMRDRVACHRECADSVFPGAML